MLAVVQVGRLWVTGAAGFEIVPDQCVTRALDHLLILFGHILNAAAAGVVEYS